MLIDEEIEGAKQAGRLVPAGAIAQWAAQPRAFLMCRPLVEAIENGRSDPDEGVRKRWARLEAAFAHFIEGGDITENLIKQLRPEKFEHWELRSRKPRPSLRVFGRFAKPSVFIGTHVVPRARLGGMNSAQFEQEKLVCEDHWRAAGLTSCFTDRPQFRYEVYVTGNAKRRVGVPK